MSESKRNAMFVLFALTSLAICCEAQDPTKTPSTDQVVPHSSEAPKPTGLTTVSTTKNCTNGTCSDNAAKGPGGFVNLSNYVTNNKDMLIRTFYVLIGVTGIIVVYFVVRTIRIRRRRSRTKRYGLLSTKDDQLEMAPLDVDDDEDDLTVFDINNHPK